MGIPEELRYTKEHEWVKIEGDSASVGVTDYAQGELGDIIYVDVTHSLAQEVKQGEVIGSIEAVKTVSEIFSPLSGQIQEINDTINDNPSVVNTDPYTGGWIVKIKLSSPDEADKLLTAAEYKELIGA
jgi:glycine cleavage system H protein